MKKRTLNLEISVWYRPEDEHIHMKITGQQKEYMTTISEDENKKRGHPHLFNHLKNELENAGMWERK